MSVFQVFNWRVCLVVMGFLVLIPLVFIPPATWNGAFWDYFNNTPIIEWVSQLGWVLFFASMFTVAYGALRVIFFDG